MKFDFYLFNLFDKILLDIIENPPNAPFYINLGVAAELFPDQIVATTPGIIQYVQEVVTHFI